MTAPAPLVVAGVDLAAGRGITEIAVLWANTNEVPKWDAAHHRAVPSDAQIIDALAEVRPRVIAIDAPLSLPAAVSAALRSTAPPDPSLEAAVSPYTRAAERDPIWSELGVRPLPVSFLGGLTFRALALLPRLRAALPSARIIETWPTGVFRSLGIAPHLPASARIAKSSQAWRAAMQTALTAHIAGLSLPAPGDLPLGADLLDALAAALAALAFARDAYHAIGDTDEGQIILPLPLALP
jgi:predicted nuclease with RNAse H fold